MQPWQFAPERREPLWVWIYRWGFWQDELHKAQARRAEQLNSPPQSEADVMDALNRIGI